MLRHIANKVHLARQQITRAYCSNSKRIFDRETKKKQRDRTALLENSKDFDYLREEVASSLLDRLDDVLDREFPVAADLGSLTGVNLKHIQDKGGIKKLFQVELSEKMLRRDEKEDTKYEIKPIRVVGDEEFVPFKARSLDLIFSNLSLHWVNDLPGSLIQIRHTLKEDGLFLAAMLGENTLIELRNSFYLAEQEREGGLSPHVSPFAGVADMGNLLTRAGFALPTVDTESFTIRYKDPWVLFSDLRAMGESNAIFKRRLSTPPSTLMAAAAAYQAMYGAADGSIPATFQVVYMIGWAPSKNQPQPKKRGSATHSLKDIENITTGGCRKDLSNK